MERGPMALFGAIIAVGLGPALWLGAQFGDVSPDRPPAVVVDQVRHPGGSGAGAVPDDDPTILHVDADDRPVPVAVTTSARPQRTVTPPRTQPSVSAQPTNASPTAEPSASVSAPVTESPTESTEQPTAPPLDVPPLDRPLPDGPLGVDLTLASR
jgi:hypothetical protein